MLIITRHANQGFTIRGPKGEEIYIRLLSLDKEKEDVKIGISAPKEFDIERDNCVSTRRRNR